MDRRTFIAGAGVSLAGVFSSRVQGQTGGQGPDLARANYPLEPLTRGPKSHFFGYYDKCPWDRTGHYLLGMEIGFCDRQPNPGEALTVGMIDLKNANRYIRLDTTTAWSWQQGTMFQWRGPAADREVIYNGFEDGRYLSIVRDVHGGKTRRLPRPIYAVSSDGLQAVTLDFDRVNRMRPGYGYMEFPDRFKDVPAPKDGGIYWMDLQTGANKLIIPIAWAANHKPDDRFKGAHHWFNHLQFNPSGTRFIFLHRWRPPERKGHVTRMYTAKPDGTDIRLHADVDLTSHFDWRDDDTILAWSRVAPKEDRFHLYDVRTDEVRVVGEGVLRNDGHCSYSPDRKWILTDSYPDRNQMQHLMLYRVSDGRLFEIGEFHLDRKLTGQPYRCDLHPRWNRDGTRVCIDSAHDGTRQLYIIDVSRITRG